MSAEQTTETARNPADMECPRCGYRVGTDGWTVCPECGLSGSDAAAAEKFTRELVERGGERYFVFWFGFGALAVNWVVLAVLKIAHTGVIHRNFLIASGLVVVCALLSVFASFISKTAKDYSSSHQYRVASQICRKHAWIVNLPWIMSFLTGWLCVGAMKIGQALDVDPRTILGICAFLNFVYALVALVWGATFWARRYRKDCLLSLLPVRSDIQVLVWISLLASVLASFIIPVLILVHTGMNGS
jgi:hypothetical protein